jgi:hypothetical protein
MASELISTMACGHPCIPHDVTKLIAHSIHVGVIQVDPLHVDLVHCTLLPRQQMDLFTPSTSTNSSTHSIALFIIDLIG